MNGPKRVDADQKKEIDGPFESGKKAPQKKKFQNNRLANITNWENETPNIGTVDFKS